MFASSDVTRARIMKIPKTIPKHEILSWPFSKFKDYQYYDVSYSSETYEFDGLSGYPDALKNSEKWSDMAIWHSPDFENFWLVNFGIDEYNLFVVGDTKKFEDEFGTSDIENLDNIYEIEPTEKLGNLVDYFYELLENRGDHEEWVSFKRSWQVITSTRTKK